MNRLYSALKPSESVSDSIVDEIVELNDESIVKNIEQLADVDTIGDLFSAVDAYQFLTKHTKEFSESIAKILYDLVSQQVFDKFATEFVTNVFDDKSIDKLFDLYELDSEESTPEIQPEDNA